MIRWKKFKFAWKISIGFGLILFLLVLVVSFTLIGTSDIEDKANKVIFGNKYDSFFAQAEIDYSDWANKLNSELTERQKDKIEIQTNPDKEKFGKWLNENGCQKVIKAVPSLDPVFKKLKESHISLYSSGENVSKNYIRKNKNLIAAFSELIDEHNQLGSTVGKQLAEEAGSFYTIQAQLRNNVQIAVALVKSIDADPSLADYPDAKKSKSLTQLRHIYYNSGKTQCIIVFSSDGICLQNPKEESWQDNDMTKFSDKKGKNIWHNIQNVIKNKDKEGLMLYHWDLPFNKDKAFPVLSFVKEIEGWNWIILSSVYLDLNNTALLKRVEQYISGTPFSFGISLNPADSKLGKFLLKDEAKLLYPELKKKFDAIKAPHLSIYEKIGEIQKFINNMKIIDATILYQTKVKDIMNTVEKYLKEAILYEVSMEQKYALSGEIYTKETIPALNSIKKLLHQIRSELKNNSVTDAKMKVSVQQTKYAVIFVGGIAIAAGIILAVFISSALSIPLNKMMERIILFSEGDFRTASNKQPIDIDESNKDEANRAARLLIFFGDKFRTIIKDVSVDIENINALSNNLTLVSHEMASMFSDVQIRSNEAVAAAEQTSANIKKIASGAQEVSAQVSMVVSSSQQISGNMEQIDHASARVSDNLNMITESSGQISNAITSIASAVEEMTSSLDEVSKNSAKCLTVTNDASVKAKESFSIMNNLGTAAQEINVVIELIKGIAAQTNLLAINATIEAACAGEAGKGFAVVASEVKELSKQTANATENIRKRISEMQNNTAQAIFTINSISGVIENINMIMAMVASAVEQQTITMHEISKNTASTASAADSVSHKVKEAASHAKESSGYVHDVLKYEIEFVKNLGEVGKAAVYIAQEAMEASKGTDTVTQNMHGLNNNISTTSGTAEKIKDWAKDLGTLAGRIYHAVVWQFKV